MFPTIPVDAPSPPTARRDRRPTVHTVLLVGILVTGLVSAISTSVIAYVVIELVRAIGDLQDAFGADSFGP